MCSRSLAMTHSVDSSVLIVYFGSGLSSVTASADNIANQ